MLVSGIEKDEDLLRIVDDLVPERNEEDEVKAAERILMMRNQDSGELEDEIQRLGKDNDQLSGTLKRMKAQQVELQDYKLKCICEGGTKRLESARGRTKSRSERRESKAGKDRVGSERSRKDSSERDDGQNVENLSDSFEAEKDQ